MWPKKGEEETKNDEEDEVRDEEVYFSSSKQGYNMSRGYSGEEKAEEEKVDEDELDEVGLEQRIASQAQNQLESNRIIEEEMSRHQKRDKMISSGFRVASFAFGGIVVGSLTMGIGLIPYLTVLGMGAAASGDLLYLFSLIISFHEFLLEKGGLWL